MGDVNGGCGFSGFTLVEVLPDQLLPPDIYSGAEAVPFLEVTTSSVNRPAVSAELPKFRKYRNAL